MKPGRELDALIAKKVMGWRYYSDEFNYPPVLISPGEPKPKLLSLIIPPISQRPGK